MNAFEYILLTMRDPWRAMMEWKNSPYCNTRSEAPGRTCVIKNWKTTVRVGKQQLESFRTENEEVLS